MIDRQSGPFQELFEGLKRGDLSRRQFMQRAGALGMGTSIALFCADSVTFAQDASPAASPSAAAAGSRPSEGTEGQTRGAGGELRIIQWQAPSHLAAQVATGDKDSLAASVISEALLNRLPDGSLVANLATEVPSVENGLLAADLASVTYKLIPDVKWSDGQPFTAEDIRFTWQWVMDDANGAVYQQVFTPIKDIEVVDPLTAKITFTGPNPTWSDSQTGAGGTGSVYPKHILEKGGQDVTDAFRLKPIGTGPYVVESFTPGDQVVFAINENYRDANKPFFSKINVKGGGDSTSAARAVLQTGEYDYAWNLSLEPEILRSMQSDSSAGTLLIAPGGGIERININFSDPDKEVDGQKSQKDTPHPIFSDAAVRQAMNVAINREQIASQLFFGGEEEPAVINILSGIPSMTSTNTTLTYDADQANKILDDAGWTKDGDVRKKDGIELKIRYQTTVNNLRQKIQAIVKKNLEDIGFKVELQQTDSSIFFDSAAGNDQSNTHFYTDLNMFQSTVGAPPPVTYMVRWYAGKDDVNIAQKANEWGGRNFQRYRNPDFDTLYEASQTEADPTKSAELFIQMNDLLYKDNAVLPLVLVGKKSGASKKLREANLSISPYEYDYWNIANWNLNA